MNRVERWFVRRNGRTGAMTAIERLIMRWGLRIFLRRYEGYFKSRTIELGELAKEAGYDG